MERIADFEKWIEITSSELEQQMIAVKRLAVTFAECNIQLIRRDQVAYLHILRAIVLKEVEDINRTELAAQRGSTKGTLLVSGMAFYLDSLLAAIEAPKDATHIIGQIASSVLGRKVPFSTVLITIDGQGIPKGVKVVSISRLARESSMSESEVETSLKHDGYLLMTPGQFTELLDRLEQTVIDGSACLPLARSEVMKQLTR
ncbi:hypothetical protein ACFLWZ_06675 [Chloroflexota bacterium]